MIKAVLFDLWGTLVENGTYSPLKQSYEILRAETDYSSFVVQFEKIFMTKKFDSQAEGFTEICKAFSVEPTPEIIDELIGVWNKNKLLARAFLDTVPVLTFLKSQNIKIGLLSNTPMNSGDFVLEKLQLTKYFDAIHLSCNTGLVKQDPESFINILKDLDCDPKDALMVGDSMETDIHGAERAGVKGILLDRRGRREHHTKIRNLMEIRNFLN